MPHQRIETEAAPAAIGPYSQAIVAGGFLFTAGRSRSIPATGKIVEGGIVEQTTRAFTNLREVLAKSGATWADVVKTTVYMVDLAEFPVVNEIYGKHLGNARPARSTVQVAALPRGGLIEIDLIAKLPA